MLEKIFNLTNKIKRVFFPFYKDKELKFVFKTLQEGFERDTVVARFVGGCVRKHLTNEVIDDIDIATILNNISLQKGCYFSRMTGSGSVCYGLFINPNSAKKARINLKKIYPKFWVSIAKTV